MKAKEVKIELNKKLESIILDQLSLFKEEYMASPKKNPWEFKKISFKGSLYSPIYLVKEAHKKTPLGKSLINFIFEKGMKLPFLKEVDNSPSCEEAVKRIISKTAGKAYFVGGHQEYNHHTLADDFKNTKGLAIEIYRDIFKRAIKALYSDA